VAIICILASQPGRASSVAAETSSEVIHTGRSKLHSFTPPVSVSVERLRGMGLCSWAAELGQRPLAGSSAVLAVTTLPERWWSNKPSRMAAYRPPSQTPLPASSGQLVRLLSFPSVDQARPLAACHAITSHHELTHDSCLHVPAAVLLSEAHVAYMQDLLQGHGRCC
jgi:hypothetical protein